MNCGQFRLNEKISEADEEKNKGDENALESETYQRSETKTCLSKVEMNQ